MKVKLLYYNFKLMIILKVNCFYANIHLIALLWLVKYNIIIKLKLTTQEYPIDIGQ